MPKKVFNILDQIDLQKLNEIPVNQIIKLSLSYFKTCLLTKEQKKNLIYYKFQKQQADFKGCQHTTSRLGFHCKNCDKIYICKTCHENNGFDDLEIDYFICMNCNQKINIEDFKDKKQLLCSSCQKPLFTNYCEKCDQYSLDQVKHCEECDFCYNININHNCINEQCQTCFESLSNESVLLTCGHIQHYHCFMSQRYKKCQVCQTQQEIFEKQRDLIKFIVEQQKLKNQNKKIVKCQKCNQNQLVFENKTKRYVCLQCDYPIEWPIKYQDENQESNEIKLLIINLNNQIKNKQINFYQNNILKNTKLIQLQLYSSIVLKYLNYKNFNQLINKILNNGGYNILKQLELQIYLLMNKNEILNKNNKYLDIKYFSLKLFSFQIQALFQSFPQDFVFEDNGLYMIGSLLSTKLDMNNLDLEQTVELTVQNYDKQTQKENPYIKINKQVKDLYPFADKNVQYKAGQKLLAMWQNSDKTQTSTFYPCKLLKDYNPDKYTMILVEFDPTKKGKQIESMKQINDIQCVNDILSLKIQQNQVQSEYYEIPNNEPVWEISENTSTLQDLLIQSYNKYNTNKFVNQLKCINNIIKICNSYTFNQFSQRIFYLSKYLLQQTFKPIVCLYSENRIECMEIMHACAISGIILIPLYDTLSESDIEFIQQDSQFNFLFVSQSKVKKCEQIILKTLKTIIIDNSYDKQFDILQTQSVYQFYTQIFKNFKIQKQNEIKINFLNKFDQNQKLSIIYTSGTTQKPKGCILTHKNAVFVLKSWSENIDFKVKGRGKFQHKTLILLPFAHVYSYLMQFKDTSSGNQVFISSNTKNFIQEVKVIKPTFLIVVPRLLEKLIQIIEFHMQNRQILKKFYIQNLKRREKNFKKFQEKIEEKQKFYKKPKFHFDFRTNFVFNYICRTYGLNKLIYVITGGSSCSEELCIKFVLISNVYLLQGAGMSETCSYFTKQRVSSLRYGHVGSLMDGNSSYKLLLKNEFKKEQFKQLKGEETDRYKIGELLIKSQCVMLGYQNQKQSHLDQDGYFHTGDLVAYDTKYDEFYILQRLGENIKLNNGEFIKCSIIEQIITNGLENCSIAIVYTQSIYNCYILILCMQQQIDVNREIYTHYLQKCRDLLDSQGLTGFQLPSGIVFTYLQDKYLTPTQKIKQSVVKQYLEEQCQNLLIKLQNIDKSNINQLIDVCYKQ